MDQAGMAHLHYAVRSHSTEIMKYLIDKGAQVNLKSKDGKTPLHYASSVESAAM
jgi:ankyrin repeat protein